MEIKREKSPRYDRPLKIEILTDRSFFTNKTNPFFFFPCF